MTSVRIVFLKYFLGNPVICDCHLRPVKRWLDSLLPSSVSSSWKQLQCAFPSNLANMTLVELSEEDLACSEEMIDPELQLTPDIKFRENPRYCEILFLLLSVPTLLDILLSGHK